MWSNSVSTEPGSDSDYQGSQEDNEFCSELEAGGEFLESGHHEGLCAVKTVDSPEASTDFLETCIREQRCLEVLRKSMVKFPVPRRRGLEGDSAYAILGMYCHGGMQGITSFTKRHEGLVRYLNGFIARHNPMGRWAAIYLSKNTAMPLHKDSRNARQGKTWIVALGDFIGGGLWVATGNDAGPCLRRLPDGHLKAGHVLDLRECPQMFDGLGWHGAEPWYGNDRWLVVAYTPLNSAEVLKQHKLSLADLGFPLPDSQHSGIGSHAGVTEGLRLQEFIEEIGISRLKFNPESVSRADDGKFKETWEVVFPCEIWDESNNDQRVEEHQEAVDFCLRTLRDLQDVRSPTQAARLAEQVSIARASCVYQEAVLELMKPLAEYGCCLRVLKPDIPLTSGDPPPEEIFLQTHTISLDAARQELDKWRAVARVTTDQVEEWIRAGEHVIQPPGKCVLTRKAGIGRRRLRAVVCGNHLPSDALGLSKGDLFANGVEALTVHVVLAHVAAQSGWCGCVIDIKCAFLSAPARSAQQNGERVIVVRPPKYLVQLGLLQPYNRWRVVKDLYGLQTSPRDWAVYSDGVLMALEISCGGVTLKLRVGKPLVCKMLRGSSQSST